MDAAYATNKLSQFLINPSATHIKAIERVIIYLYYTRFLTIEYSYQPQLPSLLDAYFQPFSDAAFSDDQETRALTIGYLFKLFGGPINWKSIRSKTVTKSSTKAELLALSAIRTELY